MAEFFKRLFSFSLKLSLIFALNILKLSCAIALSHPFQFLLDIILTFQKLLV